MTHLECIATRLCTAHRRLVRLSWRYSRLRIQNRRLIRENHELLCLLGKQQERLEVQP